MTEPTVVDLAAKKTEAEWQAAIDRFWLAAAPEVFRWLGWVASLAALTYIQRKSGSSVLGVLRGLCYVAMIFYFNAFFFQFAFVNPPLVRRPRGRQLLSLAMSGTLAALAWWLASEAITVFATTRP